MKKTELFPGDVKPVRSGVYEVVGYAGGNGFAYWNHPQQLWGWANKSVADANDDRYWPGGYQDKRWRGLTTKDGK